MFARASVAVALALVACAGRYIICRSLLGRRQGRDRGERSGVDRQKFMYVLLAAWRKCLMLLSFCFFFAVDAFVPLGPPGSAASSPAAARQRSQLYQQLNYDPFRMMPEEVRFSASHVF